MTEASSGTSSGHEFSLTNTEATMTRNCQQIKRLICEQRQWKFTLVQKEFRKINSIVLPLQLKFLGLLVPLEARHA